MENYVFCVPQIQVRLLSDCDGESLFLLRRIAYERKYGSIASVESLAWNPRLIHTLNLGLFHDGILVSAYRLDLLRNIDEVLFSLQVPQLPANLDMPVLLGCRACTHPEYQKKGFHYLLRYEALKIACRSGVSQLVSTFESSNPWQSTLKEMGYDVVTNPLGWKDFLPNQSEARIAILQLHEKGTRSKRVLQKKNVQWRDDVNVFIDHEKVQQWLSLLGKVPVK